MPPQLFIITTKCYPKYTDILADHDGHRDCIVDVINGNTFYAVPYNGHPNWYIMWTDYGCTYRVSKEWINKIEEVVERPSGTDSPYMKPTGAPQRGLTRRKG